MGGKASRDKGARAERAVARYGRERGVPLERNKIGVAKADLVGTPGLSWEVKDQAQMSLGSWVDQMVDQMVDAGDEMGVLVHKRRGHADVGDWFMTLPVWLGFKLLSDAGYLPELKEVEGR